MRLKEEYYKKFVDNELEKIKRYKSKSSTKPYKIGVCVECKVRDSDSSGQKFFQPLLRRIFFQERQKFG